MSNSEATLGFPVPPKGAPSDENQKIALYTVLERLDANGGRISTYKNAVTLSDTIKTVEEARTALNLAQTYLWKAYLQARNYSLLDKIATGAADANFDLLWGNYNSCQRIRDRLPKEGAISRKDAQATALTLLQTIDNLRFTQRMVAESQGDAEDLATQFEKNLQKALHEGARVIAEALANVAKGALPALWPIAAIAGGFFIIKAIAVKKATS